MEKNLLKKGLLVTSVGVVIWLTFQLCTSAEYLKNGLLLGYVAIVIFILVMDLKAKSVVDVAPSAQPETKEPEEIILQIIREKGRAKRGDLLPHVEISKSSLVRLMDEMESAGKVTQIGERKASYYILGGKNEGK